MRFSDRRGVWEGKIASLLHYLKSSPSPYLYAEQLCQASLSVLTPADRKQTQRRSITPSRGQHGWDSSESRGPPYCTSSQRHRGWERMVSGDHSKFSTCNTWEMEARGSRIPAGSALSYIVSSRPAGYMRPQAPKMGKNKGP